MDAESFFIGQIHKFYHEDMLKTDVVKWRKICYAIFNQIK